MQDAETHSHALGGDEMDVLYEGKAPPREKKSE